MRPCPVTRRLFGHLVGWLHLRDGVRRWNWDEWNAIVRFLRLASLEKLCLKEDK